MRKKIKKEHKMDQVTAIARKSKKRRGCRESKLVEQIKNLPFTDVMNGTQYQLDKNEEALVSLEPCLDDDPTLNKLLVAEDVLSNPTKPIISEKIIPEHVKLHLKVKESLHSYLDNALSTKNYSLVQLLSNWMLCLDNIVL